MALVSSQAKEDVGIVCTYAPSQSKTVAAISGAAGGASATIGAVAAATGLTVVTHSSGAAILTGSAGYIAGTIGTAVVAPVIIGVGLVVGGAAVTVELVCAPQNHPDQVAKVVAAAKTFYARFKEVLPSSDVAIGEKPMIIGPRTDRAVVTVKKATADLWSYVYRRSAAPTTVPVKGPES